jgi:hypothetical protein
MGQQIWWGLVGNRRPIGNRPAQESSLACAGGPGTLATLEPEEFPEGNEQLSPELDSIVYGLNQ